jgi:hypothetical protein
MALSFETTWCSRAKGFSHKKDGPYVWCREHLNRMRIEIQKIAETIAEPEEGVNSFV